MCAFASVLLQPALISVLTQAIENILLDFSSFPVLAQICHHKNIQEKIHSTVAVCMISAGQLTNLVSQLSGHLIPSGHSTTTKFIQCPVKFIIAGHFVRSFFDF